MDEGAHTHRVARGKEGGLRIQYTGKLEVWERAHIHTMKQEVKSRGRAREFQMKGNANGDAGQGCRMEHLV